MKKIIIGVLFFFCGIAGYARNHEFSVHGGGGQGGLSYDLTEKSSGSQSAGFGGNFGVGYRYFFHPKLGFVTGLEFAFYSAKSDLANTFSHSYVASDGDSAFDFHTSLSGYEERQRVTMLQIPLMLQFQTGGDADVRRQFYAAAGTKIGIPLKARYNNEATLVNAGYYAYEDYWYHTDRFRGFGTFAGETDEGDLDFKTAFFASVELGVKWRLNEGMSLYTGAYLDYGLNNIVKARNDSTLLHIVEYNAANPADFTINSIVNSQYTRSLPGDGRHIRQSFTDRITPTAAGVTVRLAFSGKR